MDVSWTRLGLGSWGVARPFGMRRGNASEAMGRVRALAVDALAGDDDEVAVGGGCEVGDVE